MYQAPALMYKTIEIRFPVSPRQMIVLNRMGLRGYVLANEEIVDELNRINRFHADEHFVVNSNVKKDVWFHPCIELPDSWDKMRGKT